MNLNSLVEDVLLESKSYFGQKVEFKDEDGKRQFGTIVDPDVVEDIDTDDCYGAHITDEWFGANVDSNKGNRDFNQEDPSWYIVATREGKSQGDYHIIPAKVVKNYFLKQGLKGTAKDTWSDILDVNEAILNEGSLLAMAQGVADRVKQRKIDKSKALDHLKGIVKFARDPEDKQAIGSIIDSLLKEDNNKTFRVSHYGLGISEKTTAKDKNEARRNVFGRLLKANKIKKTDYNKFKDAEAREIKPLNEKQMHCWKGYKKKGTKKLSSGKIVNNCVKR
jgi:hypothetical protein